MLAFNNEKNSLAHWAVIKDKPELLTDLSNLEIINSWGFTPHDIAVHLNRRSCLRMLSHAIDDWHNFNANFNHLNFFSHLVFPNYPLLKKIVMKCQKYIKKEYFSPMRIWLGARYEKEILNNLLPQMHIKKINNDIGFGLFAKEPIKPNTFIGEYTGILKKRSSKLLKRNFYCMRYSFYEEDFKYVIDATSGGNHTRFINHSNEPNVEIKSAIVKNLLRIIVIAIKPIKKEEQLLCHYGDEYWQDLKVKHGL